MRVPHVSSAASHCRCCSWRLGARRRTAAVYGGTSGNQQRVRAGHRGRTLTAGAVWVDAKCDNGTTLTYNGPIDFAAAAARRAEGGPERR